ncbi:hypothetical protein L211DRAFT_837514 [Terfezia boudieri ATCC MYA-4762]|uniref:NB-ARC domain-containing protein n=1 Tax=Terfezia boudieri ATCC MYA-4762 TaxID=1051890 RepID=A0A3N4LTN1_9PEZI|nr:hypothetical protein L211DRAFT_837514 [Terfezia boudieri ATCC MYA-4762]
MDITGFAFGTIALVGPLASACLAAYGLLKDMKSIDEDATDFQLLVDTEMGLLSRWVKDWVHFDSRIGDMTVPDFDRPGKLRSGAISSIGEDGCLLAVRILAKISKTLGDARALQSIYGIELSPIPTPGGDGKSSSSQSGGIVDLQLPLKKSRSPQVVSVSMEPAPSTSAPMTPVGVKNPNHGLRFWLRRAGCHKLCFIAEGEQEPSPRKAATKKHTTGSEISRKGKSPAALPSSSPVFDFDRQILDIGDNRAGLEAAKRDILDNLTKVQCLKWVLSDKEKGMALARELQQWNESLFKILPPRRLETPGKIRAGKHYTAPPPSPIFTGRAGALKFLEDNFFGKEQQQRQRRAVLHGLGGAGKTEIALKFSEEHLDRFDSIFWVNASSDHTVQESFRDIADCLKVSGRHLVTAVKHRLASLSDYNYLLIFDNADNLSSLATYLPGGRHGNILVTSRDPRTRDIVGGVNKYTFEVDKMSQADACDLLRRAAMLSPEDITEPETEKAVRAIAEKLGYLALAIDQAGAYIANTCSIGDYLGIYEKMRPALMSSREFQGSGYAASVYQTWELSFGAVKAKKPAAAELLMVLGYFHYEGIPQEIFETGSAAFIRASCAATAAGGPELTQLGKLLVDCVVRCDPPSSENEPVSPGGNSDDATWVPYRFEQAMKTLCNYSLVKRQFGYYTNSPTYTIHPLVHCWIRDRCEPDALEQQRAQCTAIALLQEAMLTDDSKGGYALRNRLISHLDAWVRPYLDVEKATIAGHTDEERMGVLEAAGTAYHDAGRLGDAESLRERVLQWRIQNLGVMDPDTVRARVNLAVTYRRKGDIQKAIIMDEETLRLLSQSDMKGPAHPETLQAMLNLAWSYAEAGNSPRAEKLEREVIAERSKLHGPDSLEVGVARGNLGMTLWREARYKEAEEELEFSLEKKIAAYGKECLSTLLTMGNLSSALRGQKRWASAENLNREVIDIRKRTLGERHKDVARSLAHLGVTMLEAGRLEEAHDLEVQALEIFKETVGEYHMHTLDTMENLGRVLIKLGREVEAVVVLESLVSKRRMVIGEAHFATLEAMTMLGGLRGQEEILKEVREIEQKEAARKESEVQDQDKIGIQREAEKAELTVQSTSGAVTSNNVSKDQVKVDDLPLEEKKKRRDELVGLGMFPDRWNILANFEEI